MEFDHIAYIDIVQICAVILAPDCWSGALRAAAPPLPILFMLIRPIDCDQTAASPADREERTESMSTSLPLTSSMLTSRAAALEAQSATVAQLLAVSCY